MFEPIEEPTHQVTAHKAHCREDEPDLVLLGESDANTEKREYYDL